MAKKIITKKRSIWAPLTVSLLASTTLVSTGLAVYFALRKQSAATYTITINTDGGEIYGEKTVKVLPGTLVGQLPTPYKGPADGKVFDHWEEALTNEPLNPADPINRNMAVKAFYKDAVDAVTVTLHLDGGYLPSSPQQTTQVSLLIKKNTLVGELPAPKKTNWVFSEWKNDLVPPGSYDPTYPIADSMHLYAGYVKATGSHLEGGSRAIQIKTYSQGNDSSSWELYDSQPVKIENADWSYYIKGTEAAPKTITGVTIANGKFAWDGSTTALKAGSYTLVVTGSKDDISATTEVGFIIEEPVYTIKGDMTTFITNEDQSGSAESAPFTLWRDTTKLDSGYQFDLEARTGSSKPDQLSIDSTSGVIKWDVRRKQIEPNAYYLNVVATIDGVTDPITLPITFISNSTDFKIVGGPTDTTITVYSDTTGPIATPKYQLQYGKDATIQAVGEPTEVDDASSAAGLEMYLGYIAAKNTGITPGSYLVTIKGEYTTTYGTTLAASTTINVVSKNHTYTIKDGKHYEHGTHGTASKATAWNVYKDTETSPLGKAEVKWSFKEATIQEGITITTNGEISWTADVPAGVYSYTLVAKDTNDNELGSVPVTLEIYENVYALGGGDTSLTTNSSETRTETLLWTLTKDGATAAVAPDSWSVIGGPTGDAFKITTTAENKGQVTLTQVPKGSYDITLGAVVGGKTVASRDITLVSTETYAIKYGNGTKGSSWTVKDSETSATSEEFTLYKNDDTNPVTATWSIAETVTGLSFSSNKLQASSLTTGTYSITVQATVNGSVVASMPFTVVSQDTKIALQITGESTLNFDGGLKYQYEANTTRTVTWTIAWTGAAGATPTKTETTSTAGNSAVDITLQNVEDPSGTLKITAKDTTSGQEVTKTVTVNKPEVNSSKVWTYDTTNHWSYVDMDTACGTTDIKIYNPGATSATATIARASFNQKIVVGQKITAIPNSFLNECTTFNSTITFADSSECFIIGNEFLSGCTAYNNGYVLGGTATALTLPNTIQYIGDDFLEECKAFNNGNVTTGFALPTALTEIGDNFLYNCQAYNNTITIAATVEKIGETFMYNCYSMVSTITINTDVYHFKAYGANPLSFACDDCTKACYLTGMDVTGSDTAQITELKTVMFKPISQSEAGKLCRKYKTA